MNRSEIVEFTQNWLASWTGNRPQELIEFYHPDAFYSDPGYPTGLKGRNELLNYFTKLLAKYPHWIWTMVEIFPHEQGFTLKWQARLTPIEKPFSGLDIVQLKDGKIIRNEVFFDSRLMLSESNSK